jgi:hypothetical protein
MVRLTIFDNLLRRMTMLPYSEMSRGELKE